jgi:flagellar operon protein
MRIGEFNSQVNLLEIASRSQAVPEAANREETSFKDAFTRELARSGGVNFSKHAQARLYSRGIEISDQKLVQLSQAMDKAASKGSRETLILDDDAAYVASVENRTIITAFGRENLREGVITSIDSAIIL